MVKVEADIHAEEVDMLVVAEVVTKEITTKKKENIDHNIRRAIIMKQRVVIEVTTENNNTKKVKSKDKKPNQDIEEEEVLTEVEEAPEVTIEAEVAMVVTKVNKGFTDQRVKK